MKTEQTKSSHEPARCPNCGKRGGIKTPQTFREAEGRRRDRTCSLCGHMFQTFMSLPLKCPHCLSLDNYRVGRTKNIYNGVLRQYRCTDCKRLTPTFEPFPVPDEKRKRVDFRGM